MDIVNDVPTLWQTGQSYFSETINICWETILERGGKRQSQSKIVRLVKATDMKTRASQERTDMMSMILIGRLI